MLNTKWKKTLNSIMSYFTANFYFKKVTPYSERIISKTESFTPNNKIFTLNLNFLHQIRKNLHKKIKFLHQIKNILHQTDGTFELLSKQLNFVFQCSKYIKRRPCIFLKIYLF